MRPHAEKVLAGEYAAPVDFQNPPRVLDIGANVGAFTLWANQTWPGAAVIGYEPHPDNAAAWRENCAPLVSTGRVNLVEAAVTALLVVLDQRACRHLQLGGELLNGRLRHGASPVLLFRYVT